jgi:PPOX class probable F420-dependent enzyme
MSEVPAVTGASEAEADFLAAARVGRLATVDAAGAPHAVPICFALLDGRIYSPLDEKPKRVAVTRLQRVRNILAHPEVCLVVDRYSEEWTELAWVQVRGVAGLVEPGDGEHARAVAALRLRYPQYRAMRLEERPLIRIEPRRILSWGI